MNVWIVNPFDNLPSEGNRPQRYWLMAEAFSRAGHRVTFWTSDFSHATKAKRRCLKPEAGHGIEVVQIATLPYARNVGLARIRSHLRLARDFGRLAGERLSAGSSRGADRPSLIVASTPPLGLCSAAMRVAKTCGARFACDIQDAWPETFERLLPRRFRGLGRILLAPLRRTARRIYREADLISGVSVRYAQLAARADFHLSYHGISADGQRPIGTSVVSRTHLVYVGNLGRGYDLETVLRALVERSTLTLDVAGAGPCQTRLESLVGRLRLDGRVRFHGYLDAESLRALLVRSDVGVIPLGDDSWVGLPYKLCDYLKAGLPVISSLGGECGEILTRTGCGAVYAFGDPRSLLRALDALPASPSSLPPELRAEDIYPDYVRFACGGRAGPPDVSQKACGNRIKRCHCR